MQVNVELTKNEKRTSDLYAEIHALEAAEHFDLRKTQILTANHLGAPDDFLDGKTSLDAGVGGKGRALYGLYKLGCRKITAIDISSVNIENARKANIDISEFVRFKTMNILDMNFSAETFYFVHCDGVIHHTRAPLKAMERLYRCTQNGGWIYLGLYGKGGLLYLIGAVIRKLAIVIPYKISFHLLGFILGKTAAGVVLDYLYVPYQRHYNEKEARELMALFGFTNIKRLGHLPFFSSSVWDSWLSPSAYNHKTLIGRLMAGSGYIRLMGQKQ